jgi:nucleotide-binding universal stress UspA family protein
MKTIVALVDFSDLTFKVLKQAHTLATAFKSLVVILHVVPREPVVVDVGLASATLTRNPDAEEIAKDGKQLEDLCDSLTKNGVTATARQLQASSVDEILDESRRLEADLIVVGSHKHGALYNLLVGSIAQDVLKQAFCPVLVVPNV